MNIQSIRGISFSLITSVLTACGGAGAILVAVAYAVYVGVVTAAVIVETTAQILVEGVHGASRTGNAFRVMGDEQEVQSHPTLLSVVRIFSGSVTQLDIISPSAKLSGAIGSGSGEIPCTSGKRVFNLSVDSVTLDFTGTYNFVNCTEGGTTFNGNTTVSGSLSGSTEVFNFAFDPITVVSGAGSYTMSGTIGTSVDVSSLPIMVDILMDVRLQNDSTQMVEWINNLTISATYYILYLEMTLAGRYYHPEYGYVDIETDQPFLINDSDQWPYFGGLTITGASGSKARQTVISNTQYILEVDADGDGSYETVTIEGFG